MRFVLQSMCFCVCVCVLAVQDVGLVQAVHLFQEDEGEDGVRAEASIVRRETFPQREEAFRAHHAHQHLLNTHTQGQRSAVRSKVIREVKGQP